MEEGQMLNEEQLLLLENLTYLIDEETMKSLKTIYNTTKSDEGILTVERVLSNIKADQLQPDKEYGTYVTGEDWKRLFTAIENDETLMNMKILTVAGDPGLPENKKREEDSPREGALSAVFVNEETGEAVVAFRGTAEYEWKDNFLGGAATDAEDGVSTQYQIKALEWYQGLELEEEGYAAITVVGHSKGGNKAKYITLMDTSVTRCVSFDGQGFSDEFYEHYEKEIARRQYAVTNYNVEYDFVNLLLNDVGETVFCKGYDYGKGKLLEAHCPNTFFRFDEEGNAHIETVEKQDEGMEELNKFLNSYLRTLNTREKDTGMFQTDVKQVFDFIRYSRDKDKLKELAETDQAYSRLEADACDMLAAYVEEEEAMFKRMDKYKKDGRVNMCQGLREWMEDERMEGKIEGKAEVLIELLTEYGNVSEKLKDQIMKEKNEVLLHRWIKLAARVTSVEEFEREM